MANVRIVLNTTTNSTDNKFIRARLKNAVLPEIQAVLKKYGFSADKGLGICILPEGDAALEVADKALQKVISLETAREAQKVKKAL